MTILETQRQILNLKIAADAYSATKKKSPYDARTITGLVQSSCLANTSSCSPKLEQFVLLFRRALHYEITQPDTPPPPAAVEAILNAAFPLIDELFFFGVLTRRVSADAKQKGKTTTRQLVGLEISHKVEEAAVEFYHPGTNVIHLSLKRAEYLHAKPSPTGRVKVYKNSKFGTTYPLSRLFSMLIHEACHAFLHTLADDTHPEHGRWVTDHGSHGEMFVALFRFVMQCVVDLAPSEVFRELMRHELEALDTVRRSQSSFTQTELMLLKFGWKCIDV